MVLKSSGFKLIVLFFFFFVSFVNSQNCDIDTSKPYEWPSHRNWYISKFSGGATDAMIVNMETLAVTPINPSGTKITVNYEGGTAASDDDGNLLFYSNGKYLYKGVGDDAEILYEGLLAGDERGGGINGRNFTSATQGIITVRHPLNPYEYHMFTVGDVIGGGAPGLNYFSFSKEGVLLKGPTNLIERTTEGIAATKHANGVDVWVAVQEYGSPNYNLYLITAQGLDLVHSNLSQPVGRSLTNENGRGGITFSWDSRQLGETYPAAYPNINQQVNLYDFDNATGALSGRMGIAPWTKIIGGYDIVFAPDNQGIYVSGGHKGSLEFLDISSGDQGTIQNSCVSYENSFGGYAMELGPDGNLYTMDYRNQGLKKIEGNINAGTGLSYSIVSGTSAMSSWGLPTIYIPPSDHSEIQTVDVLCDTSGVVDLNTTLKCRGIDAETLLGDYDAYWGNGIVDRNKGFFDPQVAGIGIHEIGFMYGYPDTIEITVSGCDDSDPCINSEVLVDLGNDKEVCFGDSVLLTTGENNISSNYIWNDLDTGNTKTITESGEYWVIKSNDIGCSDTDTVHVTITEDIPVDLGNDKTLCIGDSLEADTVSNFAYKWFGPLNMLNKTQKYYLNESGQYTGISIDSETCWNYDTINISFEECFDVIENEFSCFGQDSSFAWPSHNNLFLASSSPSDGAGYIYNQSTGKIDTVKQTNWTPETSYENRIKSYENAAAASNDYGEVVFFTNGRKAWKADGTLITDKIKVGNECGMIEDAGGSANGMIVLRHPLNPNDFYIVATDDAINQGSVSTGTDRGTCGEGVTVAKIDGGGNLIYASIPIDSTIGEGRGFYRTTEAITATMHGNGVDVWVTVHPMYATYFLSYLLTKDGFVTNPVVSNDAPYTNINSAVGDLEFSHDGSMFACGVEIDNSEVENYDYYAFGTINLYDFDNNTGVISKRKAIYNKQWLTQKINNLLFTVDDLELHYSGWGGNSGKITIGSSVETMRSNHSTSSYLSRGFDSAELNSKGVITQKNDLLTQLGISLTNSFGMDNRYIPPALGVELVNPNLGVVCSEWREYDLNAIWECSGKSAENHSLISDTANGYFGVGITSREKGLFNPDGLDSGTYEVVFKMGNISDTLPITVETCDEVTCQTVFDTQITQEGMEITVVHQSAASYQWYDCDKNDEPIDSLTTRTVAVAPGNYKVRVSEGANCYGVSDCFTVLPVSSHDISGNHFSVFPNPAEAMLSIKNSVSGGFTYEIVSILGELILSDVSNGRTVSVDINNLAQGTYFVKVLNKDGIVRTIPISKK